MTLTNGNADILESYVTSAATAWISITHRPQLVSPGESFFCRQAHFLVNQLFFNRMAKVPRIGNLRSIPLCLLLYGTTKSRSFFLSGDLFLVLSETSILYSRNSSFLY